MAFWKSFPPGWFAYESWEYEYDGDLEEGGGGGGGGDDDDDEEEDDDEPDFDDEGDGDGGRDFDYNDDFGDDFDDDQDDFEREREREEERRREEQERERIRAEEERQQRMEEQRRQIDEQRRQMEEEARRRQEQFEDQDGDGIADVGELTEGEQFAPSGDPTVDERLEREFEEYQAQNQRFDVSTPEARQEWLLGQEAPIQSAPPLEQAGSNGRSIAEYLQEQDRLRGQQIASEPPRTYEGRPDWTPAMGGPAYVPPRSDPGVDPVPEIAANAGARAAAAAGAPPEVIAETAEIAARRAYDRQTLAQQSAWTRAAFRSTYGDQAEAEWQRQHVAELERNQRLYGAIEPRAGQAPVATAPTGTPVAPDRRIGRTAPPGTGEVGQYGINTAVSGGAGAGATATAAGASGAVQAARTAPPGVAAPAAVGPGAGPSLPSESATLGTPPPAGIADSPDDKILIVDSTSGAEKWITRRELPAWTRPISPSIPSPWSVKSVARAYAPAQPGGGLSAADQTEMDRSRPISAPSALPGVPGVGEASSPGSPAPRPAGQPILPEPGQGAGAIPPPQEGPSRERGTLPSQVPSQVPPDDILEIRDWENPATVRTIPRSEWDASSPEDKAPWDIVSINGRPVSQTNIIPNSPRDLLPPSERYPSPDLTNEARPRDEILPGREGDTGRFTPQRNIESMEFDARGLPIIPERSGQFTPYASTDTSIRPGTERPPAATRDAYPATAYDPVLQAIDADRPIETLAHLAAQGKGPEYDSSRDAYHIAHGVAGLLRGDTSATWAEPYLNDVARLAWAREERTNGRASDPRNAPVEYVETWKDAFYGSDERAPLVKEVNQAMIDAEAARTPPGKPFNWQNVYGPTGEKGLISRQVTAVDCGPNAFATILRSRGYNADPAQTFSYAKAHKYHNGTEFTGPANYARMLREEAGLNVRTVGDMQNPLKESDWAAVDKELVAGRPVTLSSPGHYWVISAKDDRGRYYAGATTLKGNPEWMPRGGFVYGGAVNTAIFADGDVDPNSRAVRSMNLPAPSTSTANTRPVLSGQTVYEGSAQRATQRLSQEMTTTPPMTEGPAAGPSPEANLKPRFTVDETVRMRQRILNEMPDIRFEPNDDMDTRLRKMVPALDWLEREYGFSGEALAGMAVNESGVGTAANAPAGKANNLWSVEWLPTDSQSTGPIKEGRWAAYPSVKAALARFVGMYAHPENGYRHTWQNRFNPDALMKALEDDKYIVHEDGHPISDWYRGVNSGRERYRRLKSGEGRR